MYCFFLFLSLFSNSNDASFSFESHWIECRLWSLTSERKLRFADDLASEHKSYFPGDVTPGQGRSPVGEEEEEEEDFYDAVEHANDFDSSGFIVSLPRLPATSDVTEDAESLYKPDEYESDDSLDEREPGDLCEAQVITKREQLSRSGGGGGAGQVLRKADSAPEAGEDDVKRRSIGGGFGDVQRRGRSSAHESPSRRSLVTARQRRKAIPPKPDYSVNLWSIMKNCIGKDLTKIPMPVSWNYKVSAVYALLYPLGMTIVSH